MHAPTATTAANCHAPSKSSSSGHGSASRIRSRALRWRLRSAAWLGSCDNPALLLAPLRRTGCSDCSVCSAAGEGACCRARVFRAVEDACSRARDAERPRCGFLTCRLSFCLHEPQPLILNEEVNTEEKNRRKVDNSLYPLQSL